MLSSAKCFGTLRAHDPTNPLYFVLHLLLSYASHPRKMICTTLMIHHGVAHFVNSLLIWITSLYLLSNAFCHRRRCQWKEWDQWNDSDFVISIVAVIASINMIYSGYCLCSQCRASNHKPNGIPFQKYSDISIHHQLDKMTLSERDDDTQTDGQRFQSIHIADDRNIELSNESQTEAVDLHDAPTLDLRECAESESPGMDTQCRFKEEMTFWSEQPPSPKKQRFEPKSRSRSKSESKSEDLDDEPLPNDVRFAVELEPIPSPQPNGSTFPIPDEFEGNFKFMNPTNLPSQFSIITPRGTTQNEKGLNDEQIEQNSNGFNGTETERKGIVLDAPTLTVNENESEHNGPAKKRYKVEAVDRHQMEQFIAFKSKYHGNRKTVPSPRASRKQRSREKISSHRNRRRKKHKKSDRNRNGDAVKYIDGISMEMHYEFG